MPEIISLNERKIFQKAVSASDRVEIDNIAKTLNSSEARISESENNEHLRKLIERYNKALEPQGKEVHINFDKEINRVVVRIFDKETSKLVYEFPYKEIRHLIAQLKEFNDTMFNEIA